MPWNKPSALSCARSSNRNKRERGSNRDARSNEWFIGGSLKNAELNGRLMPTAMPRSFGGSESILPRRSNFQCISDVALCIFGDFLIGEIRTNAQRFSLMCSAAIKNEFNAPTASLLASPSLFFEQRNLAASSPRSRVLSPNVGAFSAAYAATGSEPRIKHVACAESIRGFFSVASIRFCIGRHHSVIKRCRSSASARLSSLRGGVTDAATTQTRH